jgi:hypothetical protein
MLTEKIKKSATAEQSAAAFFLNFLPLLNGKKYKKRVICFQKL